MHHVEASKVSEQPGEGAAWAHLYRLGAEVGAEGGAWVPAAVAGHCVRHLRQLAGPEGGQLLAGLPQQRGADLGPRAVAQRGQALGSREGGGQEGDKREGRRGGEKGGGGEEGEEEGRGK